MTNPKDRVGIKKPPVHLVPAAGIIEMAMAMKNGALKYGPYNWRSHPVNLTVYIGAAQRHLLQLLDGEDKANDSGCHHAAHVAACMAIILDAIATGNLIDDRPVKGAASKLIDQCTESSSETQSSTSTLVPKGNGSTHPAKGNISDPVVPVPGTYDPAPTVLPHDISNMVWPDNNSTNLRVRAISVVDPVTGDIHIRTAAID